MNTKTCYTCNVQRSTTEYYLHKEMSDGMLNICCHCCKERMNKRPKVYRMFLNKKKAAKDNGVEFTLNYADIMFPEYCPVLGLKLDYEGSGRQHDATPSFDRFDPNKGYTPDNVSVISLRANRIKNNATPEELKAIANWMLSH